MLIIKNINKLEGNEFQLSNGTRFLIGLAKDEGEHYTFGVFPLHENNVPSIKDAIVYKLYKDKRNRRGYHLTNSLRNEMGFVKTENLTLKNFILELHIQTGMVWKM